jgi:heptosyltransferase I
MGRREHIEEHNIGLGPDPQQVGTMAVILPAGLAAVVDAIPALRHLRQVYPTAVLTAIASRDAAPLLDGCPYVDRRIDGRRPSEIVLEHFDLAVSLDDPVDACRMPQIAGRRSLDIASVSADVRVAYRAPGSRAEHAVHPVRPMRLARTARMLRLVWLLGGCSPNPASALWPTLADRNSAARLLDGAPACIVVLHPFTRHPEQRWEDAGWMQLVTALVDCGACPVVVGLDDDAGAGELSGRMAQLGAVNLVGVTNVGELVGVLERASLVIAVDSGPAALARAAGVSSLVIGPMSAIECVQAPGARVEYVRAAGCSSCDVSPCEHGNGRAAEIPLEPVVSRALVHVNRALRAARSRAQLL